LVARPNTHVDLAVSFWGNVSLRGRLVLLVAASILPLLALGFWLQYTEYRNDLDDTGRQTLDLARSLARQVDQELQRRVTALQVLAQSRTLQLDDINAFRGRAETLVEEIFRDESVAVLQPNGQLILLTHGAPGRELPVRPDMESTHAVFATGRPGVSNLFRGGVTGHQVFAVDVPVKGPDGKAAAVLSIAPQSDVFDEILRQQKLPSRWIAAVFDRKGITATRTLRPEQFIGTSAPEAVLKPLLRESEGIVENTSREGVPVLAAFSRGPLFGWAVAIAVPKSELIAPAVNTAIQTLGISAILLAVCVGLASVLARQILKPMAGLRRLAIEGAPALDPPHTGLRETDQVAEALYAAENRRQRSEQSFRYLFENSPLPMWVYDPETLAFLAVNDAAIEAYGYTREEFLKMCVSDLGPAEDIARVVQAVRQAPVRQHVTDLRHRRKDGRELDIESFSHAIGFDGRPARVVVVMDVTARKAAEAQLRQSQKMEAIGQLMGGMAHDFNNLLGVMLGNLGLLEDGGPQDPDFAEFIRDAKQAAQRGAELTRSLLAFARRQPLKPVRVDLNDLVKQIIALLRRTLGERIEIALELGPDIFPVEVDPAQLESALVNLATNARDAMPRGGRLSIVTGNRHLDSDYAALHADVVSGDYALLQVSDTGAGMSREILARVFEPFFTTKPRGQGTGLGLSMVFGFMKQSHGHINVYSEVGVGTTFRLYLPHAATPGKTVAAMATDAAPRGTGERIVVVEDDPTMRRVVVRQLEQLGYRTVEADSGAAALALFDSDGPFDLLFSDVVMAGKVDGFELARMVAERWPATKIVMTSGFPDTETCDHTGATAQVQLLSKPYLRSDLARMLHRVLNEAANDES
jgi:two-component system cell cycle sensor histidine kinase/response regulator CckA